MNKQPIYRKNAAYKKFAKVQSALRRIALESGLFDGAMTAAPRRWRAMNSTKSFGNDSRTKRKATIAGAPPLTP